MLSPSPVTSAVALAVALARCPCCRLSLLPIAITLAPVPRCRPHCCPIFCLSLRPSLSPLHVACWCTYCCCLLLSPLPVAFAVTLVLPLLLPLSVACCCCCPIIQSFRMVSFFWMIVVFFSFSPLLLNFLIIASRLSRLPCRCRCCPPSLFACRCCPSPSAVDRPHSPCCCPLPNAVALRFTGPCARPCRPSLSPVARPYCLSLLLSAANRRPLLSPVTLCCHRLLLPVPVVR